MALVEITPLPVVKIGSVLYALLKLPDPGVEPPEEEGYATIYIDPADGDLKIKYGDGTIKTIVVDT